MAAHDATDDNESANHDPANDPDRYTNDDVQSKNDLLAVVLESAFEYRDEMAGAFALTLTVGGQTVSGTAISRNEWIDAVASQHARPGDPDQTGKEDVMPTQRAMVEEIRRNAMDLPTRKRQLLHMRDVRIGIGDRWTELPYWRGALADVTGWSFGPWNAPSPPADAQ
ncbi:hypothetical protein [Curtobacterium sp. PhB136]|uniref:hypothetical protein n=1 Tax=Curtobacterium sp. PhB136 TaxID=2485181 RepID=UPI00104D48D6|nr:hypothetical protein [Curtobacterium sp. PhB136]TCK65785.1 hypothetical protein EDF27_0526 [Curtobacterium sp. PhB136]